LRQVPDANVPAATGSNELPAIRTEGKAAERAGSARQHADLLSRRHIPDPHLPHLVLPGEAAAVGTEDHALYEAETRRHLEDGLPGRDIPDPHPTLSASRGEMTIGGKRKAEDVVATRAQEYRFLVRVRIPNLHRVVIGCRGEPPSIGAERNLVD